MRYWLSLFLFISISIAGNAQDSEHAQILSMMDAVPYKMEEYHQPKIVFSFNPLKLMARTLMYVYQKEITYMIGATCMYHPSCSEFSKQCIDQYGIIKGGLLTMDRLTRCNPLERRAIGVSQHKDGRFDDPVSKYGKRK